jgi:rubrerythrin
MEIGKGAGLFADLFGVLREEELRHVEGLRDRARHGPLAPEEALGLALKLEETMAERYLNDLGEVRRLELAAGLDAMHEEEQTHIERIVGYMTARKMRWDS